MMLQRSQPRWRARAGSTCLLKGHLRTDELLRAVLDKQAGLRTGRLLSDVLLYEDKLAGEVRLVGISDGGLNVAPNLEQKKQIVQNAIEVMRCLGLVRPKIAIMSATEAVSESLPSSVDARRLTEMGEAGEFGEAEVFGPLALDGALLEAAAQAKGITHAVAGHADCMVVPNIESGNLSGEIGEISGRLAMRPRGGWGESTHPDSIAGGERGRQGELHRPGGALCRTVTSEFSRSIPVPRRRSLPGT